MPLIRGLGNHPLQLLAAVAVGFGAWVVVDAADSPGPLRAPNADELQAVSGTAQALPLIDGPDRARAPGWPGVITADMVTRLRPGMTRVDVEGLIGPPPAAMLQPVSSVDGRFTYRADYLLNLDPLPPPGAAPPAPAPRSVISLEFDASRPGHPLVKVHIANPMS